MVDEAAASVWLTSGNHDTRLEEKKHRLSQELEQAVRDGAYEHAAALRDRLQELVRRQAESSRAQRMLLVTREDVANVVSQRTGIPVGTLSQTEKERLLALEDALHARVVGQDAAVREVCRAVRRGRSGMADEERPAASMLFAGPTGVGKTELCKALADVVYGSADSLIRIDMSEYMEPGSVTRLIGAPPGYVGHGEAGALTEKVRRRPYCVVLLDEIEKAHRDVRNLLLRVMDDGVLTDSMGRTVSFKNAIVVMTSNAGSGEDQKGGLGFLPQGETARFTPALRQLFSPEFLGRIDCVACFEKLGPAELTQIAKRQLEAICGRAKSRGITLEVASGAAEEIARQALENPGGARNIRHLLQTLVQTPLSDALLSGTPPKALRILAREGKIVVSVTDGDRSETPE